MQENVEDIILDYMDPYKNSKEFLLKTKYNHIIHSVQIARELFPDDETLANCMYVHDIGRFKQYEELKSFDDNKLSHNYLGAIILDELAKKYEVINKNLSLYKYITIYHEIQDANIYSQDVFENKYLNLVKQIDALENGCIGAAFYLGYEVENDLKGYRKYYPELNQKFPSYSVWKYFANDKNISKQEQVKTYADYILYALQLAIKSLKSDYKDNARKMLLNNIDGKIPWEEYKQIVKTYIADEYQDVIIEKIEKLLIP